MGLGGLVCCSSTCFGEVAADRALARHLQKCPKSFKMQSVLIQMNDAGWNLRLESTNCKVACLPVGLLKRIVAFYLRGRQNGIKILEKEDSTRNVLRSSLSASPMKESTSNIPLKDAKNNGQLLDEAAKPQTKTEINILQDTYVIHGTSDVDDEDGSEIKLFMVDSQNGTSGLNIIHMQFRDNTWIDIIVNSEYEVDTAAQNPLWIEKNYLFQLQLCCEDEAFCSCADKLKKIIWRREEHICLNEIALKRKPSSYQPDLGYAMVDHTCNIKCEDLVPILHLQLIPIASAVPDEFELSILSSKKVKDLSDAVYTMYYVEVCYGELKWQARRRYNDFARLHYGLYNELKMILPTFPPKTWLRNVDEDFVQDRKVALNDYLQQIVSLPGVIESVSFLSFVGALSTTWFEHNRLSGVPRDTIHIRILNHVVDAGDIILFRSKNTVSSVQRTITGAEWDHVGMIIEVPNSRQRFQILEATGDGVTLYPLIPRLLAYYPCFTTYMALRKLHIPPTMERCEVRDRLFEFSQRVEGKPYIMTIGKLVNQEESNSKLTGFFCSELIAAALKFVGLMHTDLAASCFWPGCFSTGGQVDKELNYHGATYEPETIIDCRVLEVSMTNRSRFRAPSPLPTFNTLCISLAMHPIFQQELLLYIFQYQHGLPQCLLALTTDDCNLSPQAKLSLLSSSNMQHLHQLIVHFPMSKLMILTFHLIGTLNAITHIQFIRANAVPDQVYPWPIAYICALRNKNYAIVKFLAQHKLRGSSRAYVLHLVCNRRRNVIEYIDRRRLLPVLHASDIVTIVHVGQDDIASYFLHHPERSTSVRYQAMLR